MAAHEEDIRVHIDNTIAILEAQISQERASAQHGFQTAIETLRAARKAIDDRDAQLDVVTAPERDAVSEVMRLKQELEAEQIRSAGIDQQLAALRAEHEVEEHLHDEDKQQLKKLKKRAQDLDQLLMQDKDAFSKFMDSALDAEDKKRRRKH